MPITQCERCYYGDGKSGIIICMSNDMSIEEIRRVQNHYGWCKYHKIIDHTDTGEPWSPLSPGYPF